MYLAIFAPLLMAGLSVVSAQPAQPQEHVIELYVAVDEQVGKNLEESGVSEEQQRKELSALMRTVADQVDRDYGALIAEAFKAKVQINGYHIARAISPIMKYAASKLKLRTTDALQAFNAWLTLKTKVVYDIAILLTGYDLVDDGKDVEAVSTESDVCKKGISGLSIIEVGSPGELSRKVSQEIARILGAKIGDQPGCSGYLMSPDKFAKNRWDFSKCTAGTIRSALSKLSCLGPADNKNPITRKMLGLPENLKNMERHTVCQRTLRASDAKFCVHQKLYGGAKPNGDAVCNAIYCSNAGQDNCKKVVPPEGMICDENKICKRGKCVSKPNPIVCKT